jgi:hypothetical protein
MELAIASMPLGGGARGAAPDAEEDAEEDTEEDAEEDAEEDGGATSGRPSSFCSCSRVFVTSSGMVIVSAMPADTAAQNHF